MRYIDLRSDTITHPTSKMREAMYRAKVGDDVYNEDPTIVKLEHKAAELLKKEAALLVPSGTMGNLLALLTHTNPGNEVILEAQCHIYYYEVGGLSRLAGVVPNLIPTETGIFTAGQLDAVLRPENIHFPTTSLVCLENTHNRLGGKILPQDKVVSLAKIVKAKGLKLHLDGARVFNAAVGSNKSVAELVSPFDSVMFCLSKGLAAPVGSLLVGSQEFVMNARKFRKMLGGGMRQAGILAAAGLVALEEMPEKISQDHLKAKELARGLSSIPGIELASQVETNILMIKVDHGVKALLKRWEDQGIKAIAVDKNVIRLVTHYQISSQDVEKVIQITRTL